MRIKGWHIVALGGLAIVAYYLYNQKLARAYGTNSLPCNSCKYVRSWEDADEKVSEFDVLPRYNEFGDVGSVA